MSNPTAILAHASSVVPGGSDIAARSSKLPGVSVRVLSMPSMPSSRTRKGILDILCRRSRPMSARNRASDRLYPIPSCHTDHSPPPLIPSKSHLRSLPFHTNPTASVTSLPPSPIRRSHLLLIPHAHLAHVALLILARRLEIRVLPARALLRLEVTDNREAHEDDEAGGEDAELYCAAAALVVV